MEHVLIARTVANSRCQVFRSSEWRLIDTRPPCCLRKRGNEIGASVLDRTRNPSSACHVKVMQLSRDHLHVIAQNDFVMEYAATGFVSCVAARVTQSSQPPILQSPFFDRLK
jgi:hypothetical protein